MKSNQQPHPVRRVGARHSVPGRKLGKLDDYTRLGGNCHYGCDARTRNDGCRPTAWEAVGDGHGVIHMTVKTVALPHPRNRPCRETSPATNTADAPHIIISPGSPLAPSAGGYFFC